ncbi:zinc-binding dehydrogenase (plasmid) [Actinacidiphila glaucinigra]|uniref:quinone oxidoreductase family protein n=1 Tax=Actinacidiphila glaucinigra TaxID=235986 RepID=UPI002DD96328|nr:zinc-binding dehydrogenase [Actinacidiphila glaucinigra]WSD65912.1 zinc-binding dehydrogenase [Actinacidiphila glaucinigra]
MRAIVMRDFGGPDVLREEEVRAPAPRADHTLISVSLAGVSSVDAIERANNGGDFVSLPYTPGREVVGLSDTGRRVVALTDGGGYAQKVLASSTACWDVHDDISDAQALALLGNGNVAWHALFTLAQVSRGERIVVMQADGGPGAVALQLAVASGADVLAVASSSAGRDVALAMGARASVDARDDDLADRILDAAGGPVAAALDFSGGLLLQSAAAALAERGRIAIYGPPSPVTRPVPMEHLLNQGITVSGFQLHHLAREGLGIALGMRTLYSVVRTGVLKLTDSQVYPLGDARMAHEDLETGRGHLHLALDPA